MREVGFGVESNLWVFFVVVFYLEVQIFGW